MALPRLSIFQDPEGIQHTVRGEVLVFKQSSWTVLMSMKGIIRPIASALSTLLSGGANDTKRSRHEVMQRGDATNQDRVTEWDVATVIDPTPLETVKYRDELRQEAIESLIDTFTAPANQNTIARLIFNSLRGTLPEKPTEGDIADFWNSIDMPALFELLEGVYEANKGAFGPLESRIRKLLPKKTTDQASQDIDE